MQVGVGNSRVMDISTQVLSNSLIMEFSLTNEKPRIFKHMGHFYIFLDKKPISSAIFAKSKNFKPGIYANKKYKWIPGYGIFIKLILHGRMAFDAIVTL